jgi:hypothetical protein
MNKESTSKYRSAAWMMGTCGVWLIGLGLYFAFWRPALLPEDTRYMGTTLGVIKATVPGLEGWLRNVFVVMGGFMAASGALVLYLARTVLTVRLQNAIGIFVVSGLLTVVLMSAVNFVLHSDFRWILPVPVVIWFAGIACLVARR